MLSFVRSLHRWLVTLTGISAGAMMASVFALVFANAFWRYTAGKTIVWAEDVAIFAMIFGVMVATALAYLQERHVRFTIVMDLVPKALQPWNLILIDFVVLLVGIGFTISGLEFMDARGNMRNSSTGLRMWVFQLSTVLGGALLAVSTLIMAAQHSLTMKHEEAHS
ncbi:MAG: TRAP transporter small permease [Saccharospirillum sp.]